MNVVIRTMKAGDVLWYDNPTDRTYHGLTVKLIKEVNVGSYDRQFHLIFTVGKGNYKTGQEYPNFYMNNPHWKFKKRCGFAEWARRFK